MQYRLYLLLGSGTIGAVAVADVVCAIIPVAIKLNGNINHNRNSFFVFHALYFLANKLIYKCFIECFKFIIINMTATAPTIIHAVLPVSAAAEPECQFAQ